MGQVKNFLLHHFRHFNAATVIDAARAWEAHLASGGTMLLTMAGAMSTAEMGILVAELIRQKKIHGICLTGANLEEDVFNLVAHESYERIPDWRSLTADDEVKLLERGHNRVTDTCIPEEEAMRKIERHMLDLWGDAHAKGESYFPHEYFYRLILGGKLEGEGYQIDPKDSWIVEAAKRDFPLFVPGWEDSTLGNMFTAAVIRGETSHRVLKTGTAYMERLVHWYMENQRDASIGFFQIGGGIAGDFPICVVPLLHQDLERDCRVWGYFCQISDSTTSYGSYSGALPNEKITWGKLAADTPRFVIESDATIVFPLVAAYLLDR